MRSRSLVLVWVGAGGMVIGALATLASIRWGVAIATVALAGALVGLAQLLHHALDRLGALERDTRRTAHDVDRTRRAVRRTQAAVEAGSGDDRARRELHRVAVTTLARVRDLRRESQRDAHRFRTSLDTLPSDVLRLQRATDRLVPGGADFPGLGDWAVTPSTILALLRDLDARTGPVSVVECGSGTSTLLLALALRERGDGSRVVALESDAAFAEETRGHLARAGVADVAHVVDAPLIEREIAGETRLWFDTTDLPPIEGIDLLFVDAPVGGTSHEARYPGFPFFADRLNPGATVVLDDTDRVDEQSILARWTSIEVSGRHLAIARRNVRSTFLRVETSSG